MPSTAKTPAGADRPASGVGGGLDEAAVAERDVVAAQDDQVGALRHQQPDGAGDHLARHGLAAVQVGEEADAQTGQALGQPDDVERRAVTSMWWRS